MSAGENRLIDLAASISDGRAIDWDAVEDACVGPGDRDTLHLLRVVEGIAEFHRSQAWIGEPPGEQWPDDPLDVTMPWRWGNLEIIDRIATGSFAEVYRARDARLVREVALKLIRPRAGPDRTTSDPAETDAVPAVVDEGRRLARIRHPNVVTVHGADARDGMIGIWMELVRGESLEEILASRGRFSPREAALIGVDVCRALAAVHAAGLVHRDVKPQNVMREAGGRIVLMDFGIGREIDEDAPDGGAEVHGRAGTPLYMAPEVLRDGVASPRSDLYSLGVLLHHLVTGAYPVEAKSLRELRQAHAERRKTLLRDARPDVIPAFAQTVERALASDPQERFESAGAMEEALTATLDRVEAIPAFRRGRWMLLIAAGIVLFTLLVRSGAFLAAGQSYQVEARLLRHADAASQRLVPGSTVSPGDELFLVVQASRDVYVYVVSEDESGDAFLLFPLPGYDLDNPLKADESHRLPGPLHGEEYYWKVTTSGGREHVLIVASVERLDDFEREIVELGLPKADAPVDVAAVRLGERAIGRLRGIGGLSSGAAPGTGDGVGRVFGMVERLTDRRETVRGVWLREVVLENPGPSPP